MEVYIVDFEGDGLKPTKIHCVSVTKDGKNIYSTDNYQDIKDLLETDCYIVGHNFYLFDLPNLERLTGAKTKATIIDTLALSWYLEPKRVLHGLESWGETFQIHKVEILDWENLSQEEYIKRCERDVEINYRLWRYFLNKLERIYSSKKDIQRCIDYLMFKMRCAALAEKNRWKLDLEKTRVSLGILNKEIEEKTNTLIQVMPLVPEYKTMTKPKKPFKKDGSLSATGVRWFSECKKQKVDPETTEELSIFKRYEKPNPGSHDQIKAWLFSLGWEPCSFKTNKKGKEVPQISDQNPDKKGELAPSVLRLIEIEPALEVLAGLFVLRHRASILEGFLENVDEEGYLQAQIAGFTNTLRFKHKVLVNLPGVNALYGEYIRPCLVADKGKVLCGSDMLSLEDRTKQHYMFFYDPKYVEEMNKPDFDPHLDIALAGKMMTQEEVDGYKSKTLPHDEQKRLAVIRHNAKTTNYSATYGAFPAKIAKSAGVTLEEGKALFETYWSRNWSIKAIAKDTRVKTVGDELWLWNPVSKLYYSLRNEKDIFSTLNQGTGAYCFDVWLGFVLQNIATLKGQFHDEFILEIDEGEQQHVEHILMDAIKKTNNLLQLNRELGISVQFGNNYGEIH